MVLARTFCPICNERMNQKIWSGFTAATLLITTVGIAPSSYADQHQQSDEISENGEISEDSVPTQEPSDSIAPSTDSLVVPTEEAVKVGEYQSQEQATSEEAITEIFPHELEGRQAVTLYVRNIPVLTFFASDAASSSSTSAASNPDEADVKVASVQDPSTESSASGAAVKSNQTAANPVAGTENADNDPTNPVWRATSIAARLNQLHWDNVDATTITAVWNPERQSYAVMVGEDELVEINQNTLLPDSTRNPAEDALRITNLLRRQLGNAPAQQEISGDPEAVNQISLGPLQFTFTGMASWYGPGFDGNYSASGEVFNQNALTAAHRTLPFGTQVRVTNLDTGLSVVVRVNDRGPFHGDRVIDLSTAAAQAIGLLQTGVAPVNLEVVDPSQSISDARQN